MSVRYINHSMLKGLIGNTPIPTTTPYNGDDNGSNANNNNNNNNTPRALSPLSPSALILLNRVLKPEELIELWTTTMIRIVVDGAANILFQIQIDGKEVSIETFEKSSVVKQLMSTDFSSLPDDNFRMLLSTAQITLIPRFPSTIPPDVVIGDLDSAHPIILKHLQIAFGTRIEKGLCQDTTDFQKGLRFLAQYKSNINQILHPRNLDAINTAFPMNPVGTEYHIATCLCYNSFGGRYDQEMANIVTLHTHSQYFDRIVLLGDNNIVELIQPVTVLSLDGFSPDEEESQDDERVSEPIQRATTFRVNQKKVHVGVVPHLGSTRCSWLGLEWDLGDNDANYELFLALTQQQDETTTPNDSNPLTQKVLSRGVECDFNGLVSTNNWLTPVKTSRGEHKALFVCDKPVVLSISYSPLPTVEKK